MPVRSSLPPIRPVARPPSSLDRLTTRPGPRNGAGDLQPDQRAGAVAGGIRRHHPMDDRDKKPNALLEGAGTLLGLLGQAIEQGSAELSRTLEVPIRGQDEHGTGVFGFRMRVGPGSDPDIEPFGNIRATRSGAELTATREPLVDVFDEGDEIVIAAEVPGAGDDDVVIRIDGDVLSINTRGALGFAKEVSLPHPVDADRIRKICKNGMLEVRLAKRDQHDD